MRPEDDYTAHEIQERWGRFDMDHEPLELNHPVFYNRRCRECAPDPCICQGWSQADEVEFRRRVRGRKTDWTVKP